MKILLSGWFGNKNIGDESIKEVICDYFSDFEILIHPLQFANEEFYSKLRKADFLILAGGGSFIHSVPPPFDSIEQWYNGIPIIILGVGVTTPIYGVREKKNLSYLLTQASEITVRSETSKMEFSQFTDKNINVYPDLALLTKPKKFEFKKQKDQICIGVSLRNRWWGNINEPAKRIAEILDSIEPTKNIKIVFIPLSTQQGIDDDRIIHKKIISNLKNKVFFEIEQELLPGETQYLYSQMDIVIGGRLHALILASSQDVPVIGINYFLKVKEYMKLIGQEHFTVDLNSNFDINLKNKIEKSLSTIKENKVFIHQKIEKFRQDLDSYLVELKHKMLNGEFKFGKRVPIYTNSSTNESNIVNLQKLVEKNPDYVGAYYRIGKKYESQNDLTEALKLYERMAELEPNNIVAHYLIASTNYKLNKIDETKKEIEKVISLDGIHYLLSINYENGWEIVNNLNNLLQDFRNDIFYKLYRLKKLLLKFLSKKIDRANKIPQKNDYIKLTNQIEKLNVIIIPSIPYNFPLYQRIHHIVSLFIKYGARVLYIEPGNFGSNSSCVKNLDIWTPDFEENTLSILNKVKNITKEKTIKFHWLFSQLRKIWLKLRNLIISRKLKKKFLNKILEYSKSEKKIVFFQFPHYTHFIRYFKKKNFKIIYDMVDNIEGFTEVKDIFVSQERKLLKTADLVIITSETMKKKVSKYNKDIMLLENACDYEHFVKSRKPQKRPDDLPNDNRPIIGYYGAIWDWFDTDLLLYLAKQRPEYNFVLLGTILPKNQKLISDVNNIWYLGEKNYNDLPVYLHFFNTAIIPFLLNELTKYVHPVKIFEYLCAGKPVVSVKLNDIENYPYVFIGETKEDFLNKIDNTLKIEIDLNRIDRFLLNNTWDLRFKKLIEQINKLW